MKKSNMVVFLWAIVYIIGVVAMEDNVFRLVVYVGSHMLLTAYFYSMTIEDIAKREKLIDGILKKRK